MEPSLTSRRICPWRNVLRVLTKSSQKQLYSQLYFYTVAVANCQRIYGVLFERAAVIGRWCSIRSIPARRAGF